MAFCKICKVKLRAHKTDLERHSKREIHTKNMKKINPTLCNQATLTNVVMITNEMKTIEIRLAAFVATHMSINAVDHLEELFKSLGGKQFDNVKLHRTKCTMIIRKVIADSLKDDLWLDVGDSCYSIIIDESTDISVVKYLCICIRYYSKSQRQVVTQYLGMCEVTYCTAEILADAIETFLNKFKLKLSSLIGIGTDGANNLCGKRHSVYTILKEKLPKLQLVKCIAHSLHLCASKAADVLPSSLEFLCKEVILTYYSFS